MAKSYDDMLKSIIEYQAPTAHTTRVTSRISVQTNASTKAKRPSVIQPQQVAFTKAEKKRRGIHGFQLEQP